ncbi:unnamed protein product [Linum trigynum]|uniref:Uncharacterized protein n=1 Tax=Linum trigynum TaxID=586398 RepID=A0AAV2GP43_9ROSI
MGNVTPKSRDGGGCDAGQDEDEGGGSQWGRASTSVANARSGMLLVAREQIDGSGRRAEAGSSRGRRMGNCCGGKRATEYG